MAELALDTLLKEASDSNTIISIRAPKLAKKMAKLQETLHHYNRVGAHSGLVEKAKLACISVLMKDKGLSFLFTERYPYHSDGWYLDDIDDEGERSHLRWSSGHFGGIWAVKQLQDYTHSHVPLDILRELPTDAGRKSFVFYPVTDRRGDPILAYPLRCTYDRYCNRCVYRCNILEKWRCPKYKKQGYHHDYFAGVFKW